MPKEIIERGATSQIVHVFLPDSASTTGGGKTGLTFNSSGLKIVVIRPGESSATKYLQSASNIEDITALGTYQAPSANKCRFKEIDATDLPGWYELHFADALYNTTNSRRSLGGMISGASGVAPTPFQIQLSDPVRGVGSPTALPNAAAEAAGGLYTRGTGAGQINQDANGRIDANMAAVSQDAGAADNLEAAADGTGYNLGAGQVVAASVTGAVGSVTGAVGSVAAGGITASSIATDAITADKIAADAIGASELAASAVSEIQSGLSTLDAAGVRAAVGLASANLDTQLAAIDDFLDTEIAAIKTKTDQLTFTVANTVDANTKAVDGSTTGVDKLAAHLPAILKAVIGSGSTTTSVVLDATTGINGGAPSATNDFYNGRVIVFTSGALAGQATDITDYAGSTVTLTVTALTGAPVAGVTAVIV